MRGKIRDDALDRLSALTTMSTPASAATPAPMRAARRSKSSEPTVALQLRIPETMLAALLRRAGEASIAERRHITPRRLRCGSCQRRSKSIAADRHGERVSKARPGFSAEGKSDSALRVAQAARAADQQHRDIGQALGEDAAAAGHVRTEEAAHVHAPLDDAAVPRPVAEAAAIRTVHPRRASRAQRTARLRAAGASNEKEAIRGGDQPLDCEVGRHKRQRAQATTKALTNERLQREMRAPVICSPDGQLSSCCIEKAEEPKNLSLKRTN